MDNNNKNIIIWSGRFASNNLKLLDTPDESKLKPNKKDGTYHIGYLKDSGLEVWVDPNISWVKG